MQARYYDPVIGRFLSIDLVTFMDTGNPIYFNRYAYCGNNPINCIDPTGKNGVGLTRNDYRQMGVSDAQSQEFGRAAMGVIADFTPVVGSIKGGVEFVQDPSLMNAVGIIPYGKVIKRGDQALDGARAVIGKVDDLNAPGAIKSGEKKLLDQLPDQGDVKANWKQNSSVFRKEIRTGQPIRDASVTPDGQLRDNTGFLKAERNLLENQGYKYDQQSTEWRPDP